MGLLDELLGEVDAGEPVHTTLDFRAAHVLHVVEGILEESGLLAEGGEESCMLSLVLLNGGFRLLSESGRVDHELTSGLADCVRAELHRLELEHDAFSLFRQVVSLEVATPKTTLAHHALAN